MPMEQTYYQILGVPETATAAEIEDAFRSKAREVHPDRIAPGDTYLRKVAADAFKQLSEAKTVLLDPTKRQRYDEELARSRGRSGNRGSASTQTAKPDPGFYAGPAPPPSPRRTSHAALVFAIFLAFVLVALAGLLWSRLSSGPSTALPVTASPAAASPEAVSSPAGPSPSKNNSPAAKRPSAAPDSRTGRASSHSGDDSHPFMLWRSTAPPDLSGLSSADRLAVESACSYAKTQSPETYNGCLVQQVAIHATATPAPDLSQLSAQQRQAIEEACHFAKSMQGPAAYNQCLAHQLALLKQRTP